MNWDDREVRSVHHGHPQVQRVQSSDMPVTPIHIRLDCDRSISATASTPSQAPTVIPWNTPPLQAPTPPLRSPGMVEYYYEQSCDPNEEAVYSSPETSPIGVRFDEEQIKLHETEAAQREPRVPEFELAAGSPTPVDDSPYIRYAINQLTREGRDDLRRGYSDRSSDLYPVGRHFSTETPGYIPLNLTHTSMDLALARKHRSSSSGVGAMFSFNATRPLSMNSLGLNAAAPNATPSYDMLIPVEEPPRTLRYPSLTYVPKILRPTSMIVLSTICLLMIIALMLSAIFSSSYHELTTWNGIYSSKYFLFGFLPQLLTAGIFLYVQCVIDALTRITPFMLMAMDDTEKHADTLFIGLFPRTLFWPKWVGNIALDFSISVFWLIVFAIPLQSSLFSVVLRNGAWRWVTVQGVAWTLVAIYIFVIVGAVTVAIIFTRRTTGLMWDPRSLADIFAFLPRSNRLKDYPGTDVMRTKLELERKLAGRSDRIGWWKTPQHHQGTFYCLGASGATARKYAFNDGKAKENENALHMPDVEKRAELYSPATRFRYVPWYLKNTYVVLWCIIALTLLIALLIVSFLPSTTIQKGFPAQVREIAGMGGFSPANFLYSFLPSVLGMLLYLLFRPLDMAIRRLTPWSELGNVDGATAAESLLLEYTADYPIVCTFRALRNHHYRVAAFSLLSIVFLLLPTLAGGIFFPLTTPSRGVRMIPNLPAFYICLTILILYFLALLLLIPNRIYLHLPHAVDSLAEIISFVYGSEILEDAAFQGPRSKSDLVRRLKVLPARSPARRYAFGVYMGTHGKECMGVEKLGRPGKSVMMLA